MRTRALAPLLAPLFIGSLALAACGGGDSSSDATVPADVDLTVVALDGIKWEKDAYTATAGEVVTALDNASSLPHNLHVVAEDGTMNPVVIEAPNRGVVVDTITLEPGTYSIICTIPGHSNMKATLTVS